MMGYKGVYAFEPCQSPYFPSRIVSSSEFALSSSAANGGVIIRVPQHGEVPHRAREQWEGALADLSEVMISFGWIELGQDIFYVIGDGEVRRGGGEPFAVVELDAKAMLFSNSQREEAIGSCQCASGVELELSWRELSFVNRYAKKPGTIAEPMRHRALTWIPVSWDDEIHRRARMMMSLSNIRKLAVDIVDGPKNDYTESGLRHFLDDDLESVEHLMRAVGSEGIALPDDIGTLSRYGGLLDCLYPFLPLDAEQAADLGKFVDDGRGEMSFRLDCCEWVCERVRRDMGARVGAGELAERLADEMDASYDSYRHARESGVPPEDIFA